MRPTKLTSEQFVELIDQHQRLILKVVSVYCVDSEARKDLSQEIILQLWRAFPKYDSKYKFSTWAYRIALNVAISNYRAKRTRQKKKNDFLKQKSWMIWEDSDSENEAIQKLYHCIGQLNALDRALMVLYLEGYPGQETAEIMGISLSNVSTRIHRIKQLLKNCINH